MLRKPVRPSLLYSFEKNQKRKKKNMFASKHPNVYSLCVLVGTLGERKRKTTCVLLLPNKRVIWNSRWPRVANESSTSPPPLFAFSLHPLVFFLPDFCGLKLHRIFLFTRWHASQKRIFYFKYKTQVKEIFFSPSLSPGRESDMSHSFVSSSSSHTTRNLHTRGTRPKFLLEKHMAIFQGGGIYRRFIKPE